MTKLDRFQGVATTVKRLEGSWGKTIVGRYQITDVASIENDKKVHLNTGGWFTRTTKVRMNQFANEFCGGRFSVYQKNYNWFVRLADGTEIPFSERIVDFEVK
jgi:hypothetical protein